MAVQQMNISISPQMASFIRKKVRAGSYTNVSEVVRAAVRRMQEAEVREARLGRSVADDILSRLDERELSALTEEVRSGILAIDSGQYTDYVGREGLARLSADVKSSGRERLARRQRSQARRARMA
jgi:putative addiction module CopG family antidote